MLIFADFIICNKKGNYGKDEEIHAHHAHIKCGCSG